MVWIPTRLKLTKVKSGDDESFKYIHKKKSGKRAKGSSQPFESLASSRSTAKSFKSL